MQCARQGVYRHSHIGIDIEPSSAKSGVSTPEFEVPCLGDVYVACTSSFTIRMLDRAHFLVLVFCRKLDQVGDMVRIRYRADGPLRGVVANEDLWARTVRRAP
jgi:hypothetical protein